MTTIAVKDGIMCTDSQSTSGGVKCPYPAKKIRKLNNSYFACTGTYHVFDTFEKWFLGEKTIQPLMSSFCAVELDSYGKVFRYEGDDKGNISKIPCGKMYAAGSGREFAYGAMSAGSSAEEAIKIAIKYDIYSSGKIQKVSVR